MSEPSHAPWSDQPNAPKVTHNVHVFELEIFAETPIDMIFYGIIVVLFLQCMTALFDPEKRKQGGIRWLLVAHTIATFSFTTVYTAIDFYTQIISFIDNRDFSDPLLGPGPSGYLDLIDSTPTFIAMEVPLILVPLLADGLLLYRCFVIYAMRYGVMAFPCLLYLASLGMGIMWIWQLGHPFGSFWSYISLNFGAVYLSISASLNLILTLMIVARLVLHNRMVTKSIKSSGTTDGLYKFVIVVLVESCALYTASSIALLGPWGAKSHVTDYFYAVYAGTQVVAPFLITLRIANRTALTSESVTGSVGSIHFRGSDASVEGDEIALNESIVGSVGVEGDTPDGPSAGVENIVGKVSTT